MSPLPEAATIIVRLKQQLPAILKDRPVLLAYTYGSMAAGCPMPHSDVDIALVLMPESGLDDYGQLRLELDIAADIEQRCHIANADVRSINRAPLRVQGQIVTRGQLLYVRDERARVAYETITRKRYFDFQPVLVMMRTAYFARLETQPKGTAA